MGTMIAIRISDSQKIYFVKGAIKRIIDNHSQGCIRSWTIIFNDDTTYVSIRPNLMDELRKRKAI